MMSKIKVFNLRRLLGDNPFRAFIGLLVLSLAAGFVLAIFGMDPYDMLSWPDHIAARIRQIGYETRNIIDDFLRFISSLSG
jgi:hypothetical protein